MATVEERVKQVTGQVLNVDPADIRPEHHFAVDLGAESVQSIELVAMFEEEFGLAVETVGGAVDFITRCCKQQGVEIEE